MMNDRNLHECRTCGKHAWAYEGDRLPRGWRNLKNVDGPSGVCPSCADDDSALDALREDGYEKVHVETEEDE